MLQKHKNQESSQEEEGLSGIANKLEKLKEKVIDKDISQEDRQVRLTVSADQICGCGGKDDVDVIRTVPWDSSLQDGDIVEGYDETDEIQGYK